MSSRRMLASIGGMAVIFSFTVAEVPAAIRDSASQSQPRDPRPVARDLAAERAQFAKMMAALEQAAADNPTDAAAYQLIATHYWEKAYKDTSLSPADKLTYIDAGITATDVIPHSQVIANWPHAVTMP